MRLGSSKTLRQPFRPVEGHRYATRVGDSVPGVSRAIHHRAGAYLGNLAVALNLAGSFADNQKFLFGMLMRRMRAHPRIQNTSTCRHAGQLVGGAVVINEYFL